jgi:hypothetical protein
MVNEEIQKKINEELKGTLSKYQKTLVFMATDVPIGVLCLPKAVENALKNAGCNRIFDLLDRDFTKIKRLGKIRIRDLTSRLDQFVSMNC